MRLGLTIAGVLALAMGLLWVGQGLGWIHWPRSSFMLDQRVWVLWGGLLAVVGAVLIAVGRRRQIR
jgi:hypothetical protein